MYTLGLAGVVTKVAVKCVPTSTATNTLLMSLSSFEGVKQTFGLANKHLAEVLSAFEFFDRQSMGLALQHVKGAVNPFQDISNMYVLVETAGKCFLLPAPIAVLVMLTLLCICGVNILVYNVGIILCVVQAAMGSMIWRS